MQNDDARSVVTGRGRRLALALGCLLATTLVALAATREFSLEGRLERRVRRELQRFPNSVRVENSQRPGSRSFNHDLSALAPLLGTGVEIADERPTADGVTICRRWGWWTYHYVTVRKVPAPDGRILWNFPRGEPLGLEAEGEYVANEPDGPWSFWHPNGQLRAQGSFVKGSVEGLWTFWSDTGVVDATNSGEYAAGKLTKPVSDNASR